MINYICIKNTGYANWQKNSYTTWPCCFYSQRPLFVEEIDTENQAWLSIHRGKTPGTSGPLTLWLCCSWNKLLIRLARGELSPRLSLVSPKVFFSVLSPIEFWFLVAVASGLLSWGHFISSDITDLIAQILFKLNWAGLCHHWIQ